MTTPLHRPIPPSTRQDRKYEVKETEEVYGPFAIRWWGDRMPRLVVMHHPTNALIAICQDGTRDKKHKGETPEATMRANAERVIDELEALGMERWQYADSNTPEVRALVDDWYARLLTLRQQRVCI